MILEERYPDIIGLLKTGISFKHFTDFLYTLALVKYATYEHLNFVSNKLGTRPKIEKLTELGYLETYPQGVSVITRKSLELLEEQEYNTEVIAQRVTGEGLKDEICKTTCKLHYMQQPYFHSLFHPSFTEIGTLHPFLIPDFAVVEKKDDKARLFFVEVETEKYNWKEYLENKRRKYDIIAADPDIYNKWWKKWASALRLQVCPEKEFCFHIVCIGKFKADWEGWNFYF